MPHRASLPRIAGHGDIGATAATSGESLFVSLGIAPVVSFVQALKLIAPPGTTGIGGSSRAQSRAGSTWGFTLVTLSSPPTDPPHLLLSHAEPALG